MSLCFPSPAPVLPHQEPCRLSDVLAAMLSRRFGSSAIDGVSQSTWVARGGYLPGLMALTAQRRGVDPKILEKVAWASYEEPNPESLPCGAFVCGQPNPMEWIWGVSCLFDRPPGLAFQCEQAWLDYVASHAPTMDWTILPWPGQIDTAVAD